MSGYKILVGISFSLFALVSASFDWDDWTPLDDYVWREVDDDPYSYELHEQYDGEGYTMFVFNLTSQRWMNESVVVEEDTIWRHWLTVVIPDDLRIPDTGLINVEGGEKGDAAPTEADVDSQRLIKFSVDTGAVSAEIGNVPHQPTTFTDDLLPRVEDQIIAKTFRYYIEEIVDDPDVVLLAPMVRAAKRAVDTMIEVAREFNPGNEITQILPTGRSKRGWTAWLLSCVDQRVFALSPVVLDVLNWHPNLHHHWQAYGGWSWAYQPYWFENVTKYINHSRSFEIWDEIGIDPLVYNPRLADRPKLITIASGDQFFLPDDTHYFWDQLDGDNYLQLMENTDHSLEPHNDRYWLNLGAFFMASKFNRTEVFPAISWTRVEDELSGTLTLTTDREPLYVRGWWADTTNITIEEDENGEDLHRRDFRMRTLTDDNTIEWAEIEVQSNGDNTYSLTFDQPHEGYRGFFMEMSFPGPDAEDPNFDELNFTTEIQIIPDVFPYPRCSTELECRGELK